MQKGGEEVFDTGIAATHATQTASVPLKTDAKIGTPCPRTCIALLSVLLTAICTCAPVVFSCIQGHYPLLAFTVENVNAADGGAAIAEIVTAPVPVDVSALINQHRAITLVLASTLHIATHCNEEQVLVRVLTHVCVCVCVVAVMHL